MLPPSSSPHLKPITVGAAYWSRLLNGAAALLYKQTPHSDETALSVPPRNQNLSVPPRYQNLSVVVLWSQNIYMHLTVDQIMTLKDREQRKTTPFEISDVSFLQQNTHIYYFINSHYINGNRSYDYWCLFILFLVQDDNQLFRTLNKLVNKIIKSKNAIIYTF